MKIFEAFAGIGAWSKALERLGWDYELSGFSEVNEKSIKGYCAIHNVSEDKNVGDIEKFNGKVDDLDVLFYSPPCQSFSQAGKQLGFDDARGTLFFDCMRLIHKSKPKYCIMENVKGLTTKKFEKEFNCILNCLNEQGYNNYTKVINALDYTTPQNRERVFIISIRKDVDTGKFEFPKTIDHRRSIQSILEDDAKLPILHNIYGGFKEKKPRIFTEYSPTIRTSSGGGHIPSVCVKDIKDAKKEVQGYNIRTMSTLEICRLMDFDDEDLQKLKDLKLSNTQIYRLFGNSIVVEVIQEILKALNEAQSIRK